MKYVTAINYGKGFFTHQDREDFFLAEYPGNIWVTDDNEKASAWMLRINGAYKTKEAAQASVDSVISDWQSWWDSDSGGLPRPSDIILP